MLTTKRGVERTTICLLALLCVPLAACAQSAARGDWSLAGGNAGQSGWQKAEKGLTKDTAPLQFKFLWKIALGAPAEAARSFQEPLLASRLISAQGFKDFVYVASSDTLYGVDSELGTLLWKKSYGVAQGCGQESVSMAIEPPVAINFNARRAPGAPPPPPAEALAPGERRLGLAAGGGGFGLKGIYALTGDGMLHEQVLTTGADFAPPVRFVAAGSGATGLNIVGKSISTAGMNPCPGTLSGVSILNMASSSYPVGTYDVGGVLSVMGPIIGADGTAYVVTGAGAREHPNSLVALDKEMKVTGWFTPAGGLGKMAAVSPVLFAFKDRQLIALPGRDGAVVLLDAAALGGADHRTPLAETSPLAKAGEQHGWNSVASWQDASGTAWVLAAISAPVSAPGGKTAHGAVVAYTVEDRGGKPVLIPAWSSHDMVNPAPPRIANGVVIALAGGDAKNHAVLSVLNAATGEELYSSRDSVGTYTHLSGVAVGDGHAFFTDHEGVLYAFGIALEH